MCSLEYCLSHAVWGGFRRQRADGFRSPCAAPRTAPLGTRQARPDILAEADYPTIAAAEGVADAGDQARALKPLIGWPMRTGQLEFRAGSNLADVGPASLNDLIR